MVKNRTYLFLILLLLISQLNTWATTKRQNLLLQTNKTVYVSGEDIGFKCTSNELNHQEKSILYIDVCGEGYTISSSIFKQENNHWEGQLNLPDTLQTGIYLLRAYKSGDKGEPDLAYLPLTVFNRFNNNKINEDRKLKENYLPIEQQQNITQLNDEFLKIYAKKESYLPLENIHFNIENNLESNPGGFSLLVVKQEEYFNIKQPKFSKEFLAYLPDPKINIYNKLYLSGKLTRKINQEAAINEKVLISTPDSIPQIHYASSNEKGEFRFLLNDFYGIQDVIVQTLNKKEEIDIEIYSGLLQAPPSIPYFIPTEIEESKWVKLAIQRATLQKAYGKTIAQPQKPIKGKIPFYGNTNQRVNPSKFIRLNDFEEISWEILPSVKYRIANQESSLRIWDPVARLFYENPWILVDGIPVFQPEDLNVLHSEKIEWIDIQPKARCYGDLFIEGLIHIKTLDGDFSEVKTPVNSVRFPFSFFTLFNANIETEKPLFNAILVWIPVIASTNKVQQINIKCSYEKGNYAALVQAIDNLGEVHRSVFTFQID